jgi:hypothetical protein
VRNPKKETELNKLSGVRLMALDITGPQQIGSGAGRPVAGT